jgi:5S rRNA maturation endonuclease (ribonuclease M5)
MGWVKIPKSWSERPATTDDLREYVALLEELGGKRFRRSGQSYSGHALHRPDRKPSLSVFIGRHGGIVVNDFSWKKSWSAHNYLKELGREDLAKLWRERFEEWDPTKRDKGERRGQTRKGRDPRLAIPEPRVEYPEITPATDEWEATARAKMEEAHEAILNGEHPETLRYMEERGLKPEYAYAAGFGAVKDGIAIPVYDEDLRPKNVKVRKWDESKGRFVFLFPGRGNGYYFSPDFAWKPMRRVIIVEGETNAGTVYDALGVPTIGVPGASTGLSRKLVERLKQYAAEVVLMTDQDDAGRKLIETIKAQLVHGGYDIQRIYIPMEDRYHRDPMDILKDRGLEGLKENLKERIFNRAARLKKGRTTARGLAHVAPEGQEGLNTKRSLALAIGHCVVRRHAFYVPPEEKEAMSRVEDYLTEEVVKEGAPPSHARKAVRKWMKENRITPRCALFMLYEYNGVKTGTREMNRKFVHQRQNHALFRLYRTYDEKMNIVGFDIVRLLEDAVGTILGMLEEVIHFFQKLKERIDEERRRFAEWIRNIPRLLGYIVRRKTPVVEAPAGPPPIPTAASPPVAAAA